MRLRTHVPHRRPYPPPCRALSFVRGGRSRSSRSRNSGVCLGVCVDSAPRTGKRCVTAKIAPHGSAQPDTSRQPSTRSRTPLPSKSLKTRASATISFWTTDGRSFSRDRYPLRLGGRGVSLGVVRDRAGSVRGLGASGGAARSQRDAESDERPVYRRTSTSQGQYPRTARSRRETLARSKPQPSNRHWSGRCSFSLARPRIRRSSLASSSCFFRTGSCPRRASFVPPGSAPGRSQGLSSERPARHSLSCASSRSCSSAGGLPRRSIRLAGWWCGAHIDSSGTRCISAPAWHWPAPRSYYRSLPLAGYAGAFLVVMHGFVMLYEEPTLRQTFEGDYEEYCRRVGRWWPNMPFRPVNVQMGSSSLRQGYGGRCDC